MGNWYRHPRTTQERREWSAFQADVRNGEFDEYEIKARAKRATCRLPQTYDDIIRHKEKSWKKQRSTQYKPHQTKQKKPTSKFRGHYELWHPHFDADGHIDYWQPNRWWRNSQKIRHPDYFGEDVRKEEEARYREHIINSWRGSSWKPDWLSDWILKGIEKNDRRVDKTDNLG